MTKPSLKRIISSFMFVLILSLGAQGQGICIPGTTFLAEEFASNTTPTGWSSILAVAGGNPNSNAKWRFNVYGESKISPTNGGTFAMVTSSATPNVGADFTATLTSKSFSLLGANPSRLRLEFSYLYYRKNSTSKFNIEVSNNGGASWSLLASLAPKGSKHRGRLTLTQRYAGSLLGTSPNARIRFVFVSGSQSATVAIENVVVKQAPVRDQEWGPIAAILPDPSTQNPFSFVPTLSTNETVSAKMKNNGTDPILPGELLQFDVFYDGVLMLTEFEVPATRIPSLSTFVYVTVGTIDMSAPGNHVLSVKVSAVNDDEPCNDSCSVSIRPIVNQPVCFGYAEDFEGLVSNSIFPVIERFDVPDGWENVIDDTAGLSGSFAPEWGANNGPTPSGQGPSNDHTLGNSNGKYLFIDDSGNDVGDILLRSPAFDTSGAVGSPMVSFFHHSRSNPGGPDDNILTVDVINVSNGTTTNAVLMLPGNGDNDWHLATIDLTPFAPDLVKIQWRINNNNGGSFDDVAIDDVSFIDSSTLGQAPQMGLATFDINNAVSVFGGTVQTGANGPYTSTITPGGIMNITWGGLPNQAVVVWHGPLLVGALTLPGIGQMDTGSGGLSINGLPNGISILADGFSAAMGTGSFIDQFFFTSSNGTGGVSLIVPSFPPGLLGLGTFQCALISPTLGISQAYISNAITVTVQ